MTRRSSLWILTQDQTEKLRDAANESMSTVDSSKHFHDDYFKVLFYARDLFHYIGDYNMFFYCFRRINEHRERFDIDKEDGYDRFNKFSLAKVKGVVGKIREGKKFERQLNWYRGLF
jgi:hypothetical protein